MKECLQASAVQKCKMMKGVAWWCVRDREVWFRGRKRFSIVTIALLRPHLLQTLPYTKTL